MIIAVCESSFGQSNKKQSNLVHPHEKSGSGVSPPPEKSSSSSIPTPATMTNGMNTSKNSTATVSVTIDHSPYEPYQSLPPSLRAHSFAYSSTVSVGPQSLYMMYSKVPEEQQLSSSDDSSNDGGDGGSDSSSSSSSVNNGTELLSSSSVDGDFKNNNSSNLSERDRVLKIMKKHAALRKKKEKLQKKRSRAGTSNKNDDRNINDEEYQDLLRDIDETDPRFDFVPPAKRKQMLLLERQEREEKERRKQEKRSVIVTAQQKRNEELSNKNAKTSRENATTFASFDNEALTLLRSASWNNGKDNNNNNNNNSSQQNKFLFAPGDRSWNILVSQDRYKDANQKSRYSNWHEHNEMKKFSAQYFKTHNTLPAREQLRNGNRISASDFGNSSSKPKPKKSTTFLMGEHKNFDGDDKNANSAMDTRSPSLLLDSSSRRKLLEEYGVEKQNSEEDFWASASSQQNSRDPNSPSSPSEKFSKERKAISFVIGESNKNRNGKMIQGEKNDSGDEFDDEGMILTSSSSASSTSSEEATGQARNSNNKNSGNKGEDALFGSLALGAGGKKKNDGHSGFFSDNDDNDTSGGLFFGSNKKKHRPISFLCRYHENSGLRFRTRCDALVTFSVERQRNRFFSFLRREIMENLLEGKSFEIRIKRTNKSGDNQQQDAVDDCGFGVGYWIYNEKDMKAFFHSKKKNNSAGLFHVVNDGDDDDVDDSGNENDDDDVDSHHSKRLGGSISGFSAISKAVSVRTASFNRAANLGRRKSSFVSANKKSSSSNNGKDAKIAIDQKSFLELVYDDLKTALDARSVVLEEDVKPKEEKIEQGDDSLQNNNSNASIPSSPISPLLSTATTKNYLSKTSSAGTTSPSSPQQQKSLQEANSKKVSSPQRSSSSNNNNNTFDPKREVFRTSVGISVAFLKINNSTNEIVNVIDLLSPEVNNNHNYYQNNNNNDAEQENLEKEQDEELFRSTEIAKIFHEEIDKQQKKFLKKENEALDEAAKKKLFLLQNSSMFLSNKNKNGNNLSPSAQRPKYHLQRYHEIVRVCPPSHPLRGYSSKFFQNNNNNNNTKTLTNRNYQFSPNSNIHVNHHISTAMENSSSSSLAYLNNNNNNTFHHQQHNDETSSNATTSHQNTKNLLLAPGNLRSRSGSAKARSNATSTSNTFHNNAPSMDDMKFFQTNKNFQKSMKDAVDSKCVIVENLPSSESLRKVLNVEGIKNKFLGNPSPSEKRSVYTHMIVVTLYATQKVSISQSKFARARFIFEEKPKQQHDDDDDLHENNNNGPPKKTESTAMGRNNASNLSRFDETQELLSSNSLQSNSIIDASQYVLPPVGGAASIIFQNNNNKNKDKNCKENKIREDSTATDFFEDSGETKILPKQQTAPSSPSIVNEDLYTKSKKMLKSIVKKPIFVASCVLPSPSSASANAVAASSSSSAMTTTKPSMATSLAVTPSQSSLHLASSQNNNNKNNNNNNNQKQLFFEATNSLFACVSKLHPPNMPANVVTDCITPYFDIVDCTNELELEYAKRKGILHRHQKMSREVGKKLEELTAKRKILEKQVMAEMTKKFEVLDLEHQQQKLDQVKKEERSRVLKLKAKEDRKTRQQQQRSANNVKTRNFSHHNADGDDDDEINVNKHLYSDQESSSDDETRALRVEQQEILARGKSASNISVNASATINNSKSSHNFSLRSPPNIIISSSFSSSTPNNHNNNSKRRTSPNKNPPSSPLSIIPNGSQEDVKDFFYSLQVPTINGNKSAHHHHFMNFSSESNYLQKKEQHQASRTASRSELLRRYDTVVEERVAATERLVSAQKRLKNLRAALDHRHVEHLLEMKKRSEELDNVTQQVKYDLKRVAEDRKKMIADEIASQEENIQKYSQNKSINTSFTIRPTSAASSKTTVPFAHHHHHRQQRKEQSQQQLQKNNNSKTFFQSPEFRQSLLRAAGVKTPDPKTLLLLSSSEVQQQQQNQSRFSSFRGLPSSSTTPAPRSRNSKNPLLNYVAFSSPEGERNKNSNTNNENNDLINNIASSMKSFEGNVVEGPSPNNKNNFKKNVPNSGVNVSTNTSFSANNKSASFRLKSGAVNLFNNNNNNLKQKCGTEDADDETSMTKELRIFEGNNNNNNDTTDLQRQSKKNPNQGVPIKRIDSGTFGPMMNEDDNNNNSNNHARTTTFSNPTGSLPLSSSKPPKKVRVLDLENETQNGKSINNNNRKNSGVAASVLNLVSNDNEGGENELIRQENYNNTSASSSDADDELEIWAPMKKANRQQVQQQHGSMRNLKRQSSNLVGNGGGIVDVNNNNNNNNSNSVDTAVNKNSSNEIIISSEPSATEQVLATGENNTNNNSDALDETQVLRDHSHLPHEALQLLRVGAPTQRLTKEKNKKNPSKNANTSDKNANGAFASAFRDFMGAGANNNGTSRSKLDYDPFENPLGLLKQKGLQVELRDNLILYGMWLAHCEQYVRDHMPIDKKSVQDNASLSVQLRSKSSYSRAKTLPPKYSRRYSSDPIMEAQLARVANVAETSGCRFFLNAKQQLARDYVLLIDRSRSMLNGRRWRDAEEAVKVLAPHICKFDPDGITLIFFDHEAVKFDNVMESKEVGALFKSHPPRGSTDLAKALDIAFQDHFNGERGATTILVITDGAPDDREAVKRVIVEAANALGLDGELSISIVQISDDPGATKYLKELDDDLVDAQYDIVDALTSDEVKNISFNELVARSLFD